jgi:phosphatidylinositol alpha-mannosyltransferase
LDVPYNASNAPICFSARSWRRAHAALASFAPDVIHAHEPLTPSTSMFATLAAGSTPVVATFHSGADRSRLFDLASPALRRVAERLTIRVAVSEAAARFARNRVGGVFEIVPNGADIGRFERAVPADLGPGRKVLFVGRLQERKGFPTTVRAFEILAARHRDLRLIVIGDGQDRVAVERLDAPTRARVTMLGALPNTVIPAYHAACDLYAGSSVGGESFGIVLVEAMAAGLPVVASDIPGYREVVRDGVEGLLVPPRDPRALADAADAILSDPQVAARMAAAGRERARGYDWEVVVARLEDLYARAIGSGGARLR